MGIFVIFNLIYFVFCLFIPIYFGSELRTYLLGLALPGLNNIPLPNEQMINI